MMENVTIDYLSGLLAPPILEWLTEGKHFFESLPEAELADLEPSPLKAVATTREFKTTSEEELRCLHWKQQQLKCETYNKYLTKVLRKMGGARRRANRPRWHSEGGAWQSVATILCWIGEEIWKWVQTRISEGDDCWYWLICEGETWI